MNRREFKFDDPEVQQHKVGIWDCVKILRSEGMFDNDEGERAGRFLLLSACFGADADVIGKLAGCSRAESRKWGQICRAQGMWVGGKVDCQWFEDDQDIGRTALLCDVLCLLGLVCREKT
jgi:hypothetical protein